MWKRLTASDQSVARGGDRVLQRIGWEFDFQKCVCWLMASEVASSDLLQACVVDVSRHICYLSTHTLSSAAHKHPRSSDYRFVSATGCQVAPDWLQLCGTVPSVRAETENQGKFLFWPSRNRKRASTGRWKYDRSL